MVDAIAWMVAPTLTLSRQREELAPRPIVTKQAVMAGSGWEAAGGGGGGLAGGWAGWRGGAGGVVDLFFSCVRPCDHAATNSSNSVFTRFSSSTVAGYSCSETGTHSENCAADRRVSSGAALGPVLDMPVTVQRGAQFACRGRRHLRRGADADSYGPSFQKKHRDSSVAVH